MIILDVSMRLLHIVSAILAVGGAFFMLVVLPAGLRLIDDPARREEVLLKCRRAFKMTVHPCILGLLVSGTYNTVKLWDIYSLNRPLHHGLWGPHLLLGLIVIAVSIYLLAGKGLRKNHRTWLKINFGLMLLTVLLASSLRAARLNTVKDAWQKDKDELRELKAKPPAAAQLPTTQPIGM